MCAGGPNCNHDLIKCKSSCRIKPHPDFHPQRYPPLNSLFVGLIIQDLNSKSLVVSGIRHLVASLTTLLTPSIKLSRSILQDVAELGVTMLGSGLIAVKLLVSSIKLSLLRNRQRVLDGEDRLVGRDVTLEVTAETPVTARFENRKVEDRDESRGNRSSVLLTDEERSAGGGLDGVSVVGKLGEIVDIILRLEVESSAIFTVRDPGVNVVGVYTVTANLGSKIETLLHDVDDSLGTNVDIPFTVGVTSVWASKGGSSDGSREGTLVVVPDLDSTSIEVADDSLSSFLEDY